MQRWDESDEQTLLAALNEASARHRAAVHASFRAPDDEEARAELWRAFMWVWLWKLVIRDRFGKDPVFRPWRSPEEPDVFVLPPASPPVFKQAEE